MLVWYMLVVGLNDEMKNQHVQVKKLYLCSFYRNQTLASNVDLMRYSSFVYVQLLMVLRMVYWCTSIGIMLQRSISYTLASFGRHCLIYFLSEHMCKLQSKLLAHMQGEQLLPFGVHETCPYPFTQDKYAWASNMDSIKFQFISLQKVCHQLPKNGEIESSSLVLVN